MTRDDLDAAIIQWAEDRGIFDQPSRIAQAAKMLEEAVETLQAVVHDDFNDIVDGIGDVYVTLVLLSHMYKSDVHVCGLAAYKEISERKGTMINGFFVKGGK